MKYIVQTPMKGYDPKGKITPPNTEIELDENDPETESLVACAAVLPAPKPVGEDDAKPAAKTPAKK